MNAKLTMRLRFLSVFCCLLSAEKKFQKNVSLATQTFEEQLPYISFCVGVFFIIYSLSRKTWRNFKWLSFWEFLLNLTLTLLYHLLSSLERCSSSSPQTRVESLWDGNHGNNWRVVRLRDHHWCLAVVGMTVVTRGVLSENAVEDLNSLRKVFLTLFVWTKLSTT